MSTTSETDLQALADEELVDAVRGGSQDAYAVLWSRHSGAGRGAARRVTSSFDPDDLVQESFLRILRAIQAGNGPTGPFRPYLYQTVRSVAITWSHAPDPLVVDQVPEVVDPVDMADVVVEGSVTVTAFKALPARWQAVLWYTEVEGMDAREVAPLLGLSAGSVSALAYRAREGLRRSWLQAHVNMAAVPDECRWAAEQMGDYNRGALSARNKDRFEEHLTGCLSCSILVDEVDQVASRLGLLLVPLVLGVPAVLGGTSAALGGAGLVPAKGVFIDPTAEVVLGGTGAEGAGAGAGTGGGAGGSSAGAGAGASAGAASAGAAAATTSGFSGGAILALVTAGVAVAVGAVAVAQPWDSAQPVVAEQSGSGSQTSADGASQAPPAEGIALVPGTDPTDPTTVPDAVGPDEAPARSAGEADTGRSVGAGPSAQTFAAPASSSATPVQPTVPVDPPVDSAPVDPTPVDPAPPVDPTPVDPAPPVDPPVDPELAPPTVVAPPAGELVYLPELSGTGEPGATVTVTAGGQGASAVVASADVAPDGTWRATPSGSTSVWETLTVTQERNGTTSEATSVPGPFTFLLPSILAPVDGGVVAWAPSITVRIDGRAGLTTEAFLDGRSTGNPHPMTGKPIDLVASGLAPGQHTLGLRYVDRATGAAGPIVSSSFTIGQPPS
ncbi:sigma-70 family RNA polymerase sigma factor [Oerskovia jenensis]|uniref:RNA polymerase sigma factor (Sigma-70 family) n=1 Tax=Oerskovia jenensis TaxID=162169 RepID=A0ABS2LDU2_9CELL|nr:sigma-70 family RNA polymerase sigma factor [Oerskovia jenensis]MBM7478585.1 RNA polymerase sigma factor (sigma-70 family) [Oerskovia jenensis]